MIYRIKCFFQKIIYGFSDMDIYTLNTSIAKFMVPRLKRFKKLLRGVPGVLLDEKFIKYTDVERNQEIEKKSKKWVAIIDSIIYSMECMKDFDWSTHADKIYNINKGLKNLHIYFLSLWI